MSALLISFIAILAAISLAALIIAASSILNGWVLTKLWAWFVVPVFGLPALGVATAVGLGLIVHHLTHQHINAAKDPDAKWWVTLLEVLLRPLIVLGLGAVVHCFV